MLRAATERAASAAGCFAARDGARSTGPTPLASGRTRSTRGGASMPLVRDTVPAIRASTVLATNVTGEPRAFAALAVTVWLLVPTVLPTVSVALARPFPFVVVLAGDALPPPAVTVHATLNPATGWPVASMAFTTKGAPRGAPTRPVWASPETGVRTTTDGVVDSLPQARAMATAASENRFIVASPGSPVSCRKTSGRVRGAVRLLDTHPRAAADSAPYARPPTYVPASQSPPELTARALIVGVALGLIFSASSVYLALKIGLTVSSSIPIAVLSITIFRALGRTSILENNIVQTTGSASDSVAAGVVFTIPAILLRCDD